MAYNPDRVVEQLGKRIVELRTKAELSQGDLAAKLGTTPQWVSQLEHGTRSPTVHTLVKIANAFGVTIEELFEFTQTRERTPARQKKGS